MLAVETHHEDRSLRDATTRPAYVRVDGALTARLKPLSVVKAPRLLVEEDASSRRERLQDACQLLADGFDGLDGDIREYVHSVPLVKGDTDRHDAERFLDWLSRRCHWSDEQQDLLICQQAHNAVAFVAIRRRLAHARFQALLASGPPSAELHRKGTVYLNPIRIWSTFETHALLQEEAGIPATVLFFAIGGEIRTAVLEADAEELVKSLEQTGPIPVQKLIGGSADGARAKLMRLILALRDLGIVAVAP